MSPNCDCGEPLLWGGTCGACDYKEAFANGFEAGIDAVCAALDALYLAEGGAYIHTIKNRIRFLKPPEPPKCI